LDRFAVFRLAVVKKSQELYLFFTFSLPTQTIFDEASRVEEAGGQEESGLSIC